MIRFLTAMLLVLTLQAGANDSADTFTLYLVRHAEKASDGSNNPDLTPAGHERAETLAGWLQAKPVQAIWSSDYQRTQQTAAPLAALTGLPVTSYDPRDGEGLAVLLVDQGLNALVVGHSNTIPELAAQLCSCEVAPMDDNEYGRLLVVTVSDQEVSLVSLDQDQLPPDS
jgi:broad specificity phosphatase PhoE